MGFVYASVTILVLSSKRQNIDYFSGGRPLDEWM